MPQKYNKENTYWPMKDFAIGNLFLDQKNIRTPISEKAQDALIQDLFSNEDAFDLVKSFVQNNLFPDEFPIVVKENGKLIVIEGNRRLAALRALNEPAIVPSFKDKIKALKNPGIDKIKVVIAPNRNAAIKHIANKHTINYRRPWKPLRQAYFYKSQIDNGSSIEQIKKDYPDHDIPKFMRMLEMHHLAKSQVYDDNQITRKVHDERKFPISTLERIYDKPSVQSFLGVTFDADGMVKGKIDINEFRKGYQKIIEDIAEGIIDSRKTNTSGQIQKYINDLPSEFRPDTSKSGRFGSKDFKEVKTDKPNISEQFVPRSNRKPEGLFHPSHVPFKIKNSSLKFLYDELKGIDVENFPNATHDLLRSFLECSLVYYLKETGEYKSVEKNQQHNPSLHEMLNFVSAPKCSSIQDSNIKQVVEHVMSNYNKTYSLARMNMINHNENWNSTGKDVRSAWSKLESLMKILLNPKPNASNSK